MVAVSHAVGRDCMGACLTICTFLLLFTLLCISGFLLLLDLVLSMYDVCSCLCVHMFEQMSHGAHVKVKEQPLVWVLTFHLV